MFTFAEKDKQITKLTLENYNYKLSWEVPYSDTNLDDILNALYSLCIGATYHPESVLRSMKEFAEERLPKDDTEYLEDEK